MIFLYTTEGCPFSEAALDLVKKLKVPYKNIKVKSLDQKEKLQDYSGMRTFPQIYFRNKKGQMILLGGYNDFQLIIEFCKKTK